MRINQFTTLTDEMHELFESCKTSGFTEEQAFELTKTYCSVAFANQSIRMSQDHYDRMRTYRRRSNDL